jgi:hypothetical protein
MRGESGVLAPEAAGSEGAGFVCVSVVGATVRVSVGLEPGAGAGEPTCASQRQMALSIAAAPQKKGLKRLAINMMEVDECGSV